MFTVTIPVPVIRRVTVYTEMVLHVNVSLTANLDENVGGDNQTDD